MREFERQSAPNRQERIRGLSLWLVLFKQTAFSQVLDIVVSLPRTLPEPLRLPGADLEVPGDIVVSQVFLRTPTDTKDGNNTPLMLHRIFIVGLVLRLKLLRFQLGDDLFLPAPS